MNGLELKIIEAYASALPTSGQELLHRQLAEIESVGRHWAAETILYPKRRGKQVRRSEIAFPFRTAEVRKAAGFSCKIAGVPATGSISVYFGHITMIEFGPAFATVPRWELIRTNIEELEVRVVLDVMVSTDANPASKAGPLLSSRWLAEIEGLSDGERAKLFDPPEFYEITLPGRGSCVVIGQLESTEFVVVDESDTVNLIDPSDKTSRVTFATVAEALGD